MDNTKISGTFFIFSFLFLLSLPFGILFRSGSYNAKKEKEENTTDTEKIIIDIPSLTDGNKDDLIKKGKPKIRPLSVIAALLGIFSLCIHLALAAEGIDYMIKSGGEDLFSVLIPNHKISEPMEPPLPQQETVEDNDKDKPQDFKIRNSDLSANAEYGLSLTNETSYAPDLYQLLGATRPSLSAKELDKKYGKGCKKVLLYHTHATEGFADTYETSFRTKDKEKNMIAVGDIIYEVLTMAGIETVHLTEQFDKESFNDAYDRSNEAVLSVLKENPSIQYVFDVHRDCIGNADDGYVRAVMNIYGKPAAQLMFVCGTDEGGSSHTAWRQNLTASLHLQSSLVQSYPRLMRPVNLRRASFYQDSAPTSLIIECGTCAGTLVEAKRGAVLFAKSLADYVLGKDCGLDCEELISSLCP